VGAGGAARDRIVVQTEGVNFAAVWQLASTFVPAPPPTPVHLLATAASAAPAGNSSKSAGRAAAAAREAAAAAAIALLPRLPAGASALDAGRLHSNDIAGLLRTYGVEAARAAIVRECKAVFDVYGIGVDLRHLYLIADYMTHGGGFRAMNRGGMEGAHGSPLLKMSFETTMAFLQKAVLAGETDALTTPAARIVFGRVVDSGTGCFDVWSPLGAGVAASVAQPGGAAPVGHNAAWGAAPSARKAAAAAQTAGDVQLLVPAEAEEGAAADAPEGTTGGGGTGNKSKRDRKEKKGHKREA
jgi:hypothetical protein